MAEKRTNNRGGPETIADDEKTVDSGYELDLDDTISAWDQVVEEAVAAVDKKDETMGEGAEAPPEGEEAAAGEPRKAAQAAEEAARVPRDEDDTEVRSLRDHLLRTLADFDNYRKRAERDKVTIERYALFDVLKDFLDVADNLERALAASGSAEDLKQGVGLIVRQLADLLRRYGVTPVEAVGKAFDPTEHEAVSREERDDVDEPTVIAELQRGFWLHDRLLRPAMVSVAMPAPRPERPDDDEPTDEEKTAGDSRSEDREPEDREPASEEPSSEEIAQATEVN